MALCEKSDQLSEYIVEYVFRYSFQPPPVTRGYVKRPRLITANKSVRPCARSRQ
jgi:hypothetical protein